MTDLKQEAQYNDELALKLSDEAPASQAHAVMLCYLALAAEAGEAFFLWGAQPPPPPFVEK